MIRLDATTRKIQVVLSGAVTTNQLPVSVSYSDKTAAAYTGAMQLTNTNGTTQVDICAAPASGAVRDIDFISIRNRDTAAATVTVLYDDNGTDYQIISAALDVGDVLTYVHGSAWQVVTSTGQLKTSATGSGTGTVTSVAMTVPSVMSVSGSPITTAGTLAVSLAAQSQNTLFSGPTSGAAATPTFRALVPLDLTLTTKGDILGVNASPALGRLGVGTDGQVLTADSASTFGFKWSAAGGGSGTVTSVAMTVPTIMSVSGSPITSSGTLAVSLANQSANLMFAGPSTGAAAAPTFRSLVTADMPSSVLLNTLLTAKGSLISASAANTASVLAVGTNGQVLTADSSTTTGLKWAAGGAGDVTGPSSSTNNRLATFNSTTGKIIQDNTTITANGAFLAVSTGRTLRIQAEGASGNANYWSMSGVNGGSTNAVVLESQGIDANVHANIITQGAGDITLAHGSSAQRSLKLLALASAVNYTTFQGGTTGNPAVMTTAGSDTNIDLTLTPKGTGNLIYSPATASTAAAFDASKKLVSVANTGSGNNVLATSPTLVTPLLGTPTSGVLTNCTGLPISSGIAGLGTGVATALAVNVGSAGAFVTFNGALGTPSSGTVTNLTGTASININGTVGATTPNTGAFTTLSAGNTSITGTLNVSTQLGVGGANVTGSGAQLHILAAGGSVFRLDRVGAGNSTIQSVETGVGYRGLVIDSSQTLINISGVTVGAISSTGASFTGTLGVSGEVTANNGIIAKGTYSTNAASQAVLQGNGNMYINGPATGAGNVGAFTLWLQDSAGANYVNPFSATSAGASITGTLGVSGNVTFSGYGSGGGLISVGAADSGGTGYKVLRVPN